jgi:hypothetical protein
MRARVFCKIDMLTVDVLYTSATIEIQMWISPTSKPTVEHYTAGPMEVLYVDRT